MHEVIGMRMETAQERFQHLGWYSPIGLTVKNAGGPSNFVAFTQQIPTKFSQQ